MWLDPQLLRQLARISGIAFQAVAVLVLGLGAGLWVDHLQPSIGQAGVIVGGVLGAGGSIWVTVAGSRAVIEEDEHKETP